MGVDPGVSSDHGSDRAAGGPVGGDAPSVEVPGSTGMPVGAVDVSTHVHGAGLPGSVDAVMPEASADCPAAPGPQRTASGAHAASVAADELEEPASGHQDIPGDGLHANGEPVKRLRDELQHAELDPVSPAKHARTDLVGQPDGDAAHERTPPNGDVHVQSVATLEAKEAPVQVATTASGRASEHDPALQRLLERVKLQTGPAGRAQDTLPTDGSFWEQLQTVEVPGADALQELPPLQELLEHTLQSPQLRSVSMLCARVLARLQVREGLAAFASHTESLIGEVQQGRIEFRQVDNSIIVVADALRRLTAAGDALERGAGSLPLWQEPEAQELPLLPRAPQGDAFYVRCVAEHGVLRRCLQVLKLPALIVDSLVETGSVLSAVERRSLFRRLRSHFVSPLRVRPNLLAPSAGFVAALLCGNVQWRLLHRWSHRRRWTCSAPGTFLVLAVLGVVHMASVTSG